MNRRERRQLQKQLGLNKHYKKETRNTKFARWKENQENGDRMQQDMKERVKQMENMSEDEKLNKQIEIEATKIAQKKQIPIVDALVEAQEKILKLKR
jgi:hypothetical protein